MQVPPGVGPGQPVKFMAEGQSFAAAVPEGYSPGVTFHATVTLGKNFAEKDCLCKSELRTNEPRQEIEQERWHQKQELIHQREQREQQSTACPPARTMRAPPRPITPVS